uniref:Uncharacterized protein n=1 Tax=Heterorhabditis bacteriophora TaxID=37862 RepID=A0A1I7XK86_HETBA
MLVIPSAEIHVRVVHDIKYAQGSSNTNFNNEYDGFLYRPKSAEFTVYTSEECKKTIGRFMLYEMRSKREWTVESLPNPEHLFNKMSTKQWFNTGRFHRTHLSVILTSRRMAFPHTMHRVVRRNIIYGWKHVAPFVFAYHLFTS